jgi:hypothetical protein
MTETRTGVRKGRPYEGNRRIEVAADRRPAVPPDTPITAARRSAATSIELRDLGVKFPVVRLRHLFS